jgi:hypothetical protein
MIKLLVALQVFQVLFLLLHDWVPLGRLNDVAAGRAENPGGRLLRATIISTAPFLVPLAASFAYVGSRYPHWLWTWLWIAYGLLFVGELRAWWFPYFFGTHTERVVRYGRMFDRTHSFLPRRNGIEPNTLHVVLHVVTLGTLVVLAKLTL